MDNFFIDKDKYFKEHNIKTDVKSGDILAPKQVKAQDILLGKSPDKVVKNMSDIFPKSERCDND